MNIVLTKDQLESIIDNHTNNILNAVDSLLADNDKDLVTTTNLAITKCIRITPYPAEVRILNQIVKDEEI